MTPTLMVFPAMPRPDPPVPEPGAHTFWAVPKLPAAALLVGALVFEAVSDGDPPEPEFDREHAADARTATENTATTVFRSRRRPYKASSRHNVMGCLGPHRTGTSAAGGAASASTR